MQICKKKIKLCFIENVVLHLPPVALKTKVGVCKKYTFSVGLIKLIIGKKLCVSCGFEILTLIFWALSDQKWN